MSTFMQLMEGKNEQAVVGGVRVSKSGKMFFRMGDKVVSIVGSSSVAETMAVQLSSWIGWSRGRIAPSAVTKEEHLRRRL